MAGYLDISVYDWDGIGPLRQVFNTADPDESLFKGKVYIMMDTYMRMVTISVSILPDKTVFSL